MDWRFHTNKSVKYCQYFPASFVPLYPCKFIIYPWHGYAPYKKESRFVTLRLANAGSFHGLILHYWHDDFNKNPIKLRLPSRRLFAYQTNKHCQEALRRGLHTMKLHSATVHTAIHHKRQFEHSTVSSSRMSSPAKPQLLIPPFYPRLNFPLIPYM